MMFSWNFGILGGGGNSEKKFLFYFWIRVQKDLNYSDVANIMNFVKWMFWCSNSMHYNCSYSYYKIGHCCRYSDPSPYGKCYLLIRGTVWPDGKIIVQYLAICKSEILQSKIEKLQK